MWLVLGTIANHPSSPLVNQMSADGGAALFPCVHDYVTHTHTHTHAHTYNRAPKTTPAWWIPITYCCPPLIWQTEAITDCGHPQITIRKMHSPRSSLRPEDTKDRCRAVKFLHLNPSRCHPLPPPIPPTALIHLVSSVSSFLQCPLSAREGVCIIRAIWFCINHSIWWWMTLSECSMQLCNCWQGTSYFAVA